MLVIAQKHTESLEELKEAWWGQASGEISNKLYIEKQEDVRDEDKKTDDEEINNVCEKWKDKAELETVF